MFPETLVEETPTVFVKNYLSNEFGCPSVMEEVVCEEVDVTKFNFPWTKKALDVTN